MSLKDWMKRVESAQLNEFATSGQVQIKPASQMPKAPGQQGALGANNGTQPTTNTPGQPATNANTQVITQGNKTLGTVNNPQLAQQIKQSIGKGEMSLAGDQLGEDEMMEVAPPGMEDAVLALKKQFPGNPGRAFATAWSMYNKKHGKTEESMMESKQLNEGSLDEIIGNHPHEHKMCQEGWGMDNSLFEALADHYYKEGRIPRSVWHGSAEELREFVESCYAKDTMGSNEGAINSGMLDEEGVAEGSKEDFTMNARQADSRLDKYATDPKPSFLDRAGSAVGGALKKAGSAVMNKLHPSDEELRSGPLEETSELEQMLRQSTKENTMYESKKSKKAVEEAVEKTKTGIRHKADAGGYGRKDDEEDTDEDGKKIKKVAKDEPKKGRGRPKKTDNASGEDKKFDFSALSKTSGSKAPKTDKWDKKKTTTHKIATKADREEIDEGRDVMEDDAGDVEKRMLAKIEKEKQRLAKLKQTDPEAYKREMAKSKTSSRIPPVSTFEGRGVTEGETIEKKGGRIHKGSYGTSHEAGDEGVKKVTTQRGRGRPKKDADDSGEVKNYDWSAFGAKKGVKLPDWDKKKTTTHKIATKADREEVEEAKLKGKQSKLDINKNGKVDGGDFALLRGKKKKDPQMESWDRQLKGLLTEGRQLNEGLTVSTSVGNQGGQDTVSITASDTDAHQLLQMLQNAGMGSGVPHHAVQAATAPDQVLPKTSPSSTASIATTDGAPNAGAQKDIDGAGNSVPIMAMPRGMAFSVNDETEMPTEPGEFGTLDQEEVVSALGSEQGSADDSGDSALAAIKKLMGQHGASEVTAKESTPPESKAPATETEVEESDTDGKKPDFLDLDKDGDKKEPMNQAAKKDDLDEESEDEEVKEGFDFADATANEIEKHKKHEKVEEGAQTCNECGGLMEDDHQCGQLNEWANSPEGQSDDEQFKTDMAFMTKVLSGGLNGQKSTGQATTPILASQTNRQMSEGYNIDVAAEMRKLAGIR